MILTEQLAKRMDGYWELVATAVGQEVSLDKTLTGLSAKELARGALGKAIAPSVIRARVEALAAYDPALLASLAREWIAPHEIVDDPAWAAAWSTSLRHIKEVNRLERADVDVPALAEEVDVLWFEPGQPISWYDTARRLAGAEKPWSYNELRKLARCALVEPSLSDQDLAHARVAMVRLLRGRTSILDSTAHTFIRDLAERTIQGLSSVAPLALEVALALTPERRQEFEALLLSRMRTVDDPRPLAPIAYVLLGAWRVP